MAYKSIGTDDKKNKIYSDGEFAYYSKTPQQIFQEKAAAYAKQPTQKTVIIAAKGKKPAREVVVPIPIYTASTPKQYKAAVNKFTPKGFTPYTKTDYDIKKVNSKGFDEKIAYNELRANQAIEKSRIDSLIEKQRNEANQAAFQNRLDVKEDLFKILNKPVQQQGTIQQSPYISSGGYSEVFQKIAGRGNQGSGNKQKASIDVSVASPLTTQINPAAVNSTAPETPMQKQAMATINQNSGGANKPQNFALPNTSGLTFGGT
jgi:hypothetical protein